MAETTSKQMNVKVLQLVKTTAEWALVTKVIDKGFLCFETTASGEVKVKIGDGAKTFAELPYLTYTTAEVDDKITSLGDVLRIKGVVATVAELPTTNNKVGDIYLVGSEPTVEEGATPPTNADSYQEYVWTTKLKWEYMGTTAPDLTPYALKTDVADQIKGVNDTITTLDGEVYKPATEANRTALAGTTASFTTEEKDKLATIDTDIQERVEAIEADYIKSTDTLVLNCTLD